MIRCAALLVAGGQGERFGGDIPKQYQTLCGEPVCGALFARLSIIPELTPSEWSSVKRTERFTMLQRPAFSFLIPWQEVQHVRSRPCGDWKA